MSDTKKCSKCGVEKPATPEFYHRRAKYGHDLRPQCKACTNEDQQRRDKKRSENIDPVVYVLKNEANKVIYVGQTMMDRIKRYNSHKSYLVTGRHNPLLQKYYDRGIEFEFDILEDYSQEEELKDVVLSGKKEDPIFKKFQSNLIKKESEYVQEYINQGWIVCNKRGTK